AGRGDADGKPAAVGEPFDRAADACRIDTARPEARQRRAQIEFPDRVCIRIDDPGDGDHDGTDGNRDFWSASRAEIVYKPSRPRREPSLKGDENTKGELDLGDLPPVRVVHRL